LFVKRTAFAGGIAGCWAAFAGEGRVIACRCAGGCRTIAKEILRFRAEHVWNFHAFRELHACDRLLYARQLFVFRLAEWYQHLFAGYIEQVKIIC
jgi:hypothetical protein